MVVVEFPEIIGCGTGKKDYKVSERGISVPLFSMIFILQFRIESEDYY